MVKADIIHRLAESNIRLEENAKQMKEANVNISNTLLALKDAVESMNDHLIYHTKKIDSIGNECQVINQQRENRMWKGLTILLVILLIVLGVKEAAKILIGGV